MQQNRFDDAVAAYRRAVKIDPDDPVHPCELYAPRSRWPGKLDEANLYSHFAILLKDWTERMNPSVASVFRGTCDFRRARRAWAISSEPANGTSSPRTSSACSSSCVR